MNNSLKPFTIGVLAAQAGVNVETIRFYQRKNLLRAPSREVGSIRRYGQSDIDRVHFIKSAQRLGFSLDEVAQLLTLDDGTHCGQAREQAQQKLTSVRAKLVDLQQIERVLSGLVDRCSSAPEKICCPLIAALQGRSAASLGERRLS